MAFADELREVLSDRLVTAADDEGGRLDLEGGFAQFGQIAIDGRVRGRADRGRHPRKHGQCRTMDMPRCDQLHA